LVVLLELEDEGSNVSNGSTVGRDVIVIVGESRVVVLRSISVGSSVDVAIQSRVEGDVESVGGVDGDIQHEFSGIVSKNGEG